jgi:hypothetical protein
MHINAQKADSIYVHLYTDSLKKGTYNYINIDGKLPGGRFIPLDTADVMFSSSGGKFFGNSLWIDPAFSRDSVWIKVVLKSNPKVFKQFTLFIKRKPDGQLKTLEEIMKESKSSSKKVQPKNN